MPELLPVSAKRMVRLKRASSCVNDLPGHMPSGFAGQEHYHASGIVRLIEFRHSRRYAPLVSHLLGHPAGIGCAWVNCIDLMPRGANSDARLSVKASIAPLVAA